MPGPWWKEKATGRLVRAVRVPMSADDTRGWNELGMHLGRRVGPTPPYVPQADGIMRSRPGDWIVRGVGGELRVLLPSTFTEEYEESDE